MQTTWRPLAHALISREEYAKYASRVVRLLAGGADDIEIADYLGEVERTAFGLPPGARDLLHVAQQIRRAVAESGKPRDQRAPR